MWEKLVDAIERKNVAVAKQLLRQAPELAKAKNYQDETLLHLAAHSGSAEIVADLLVRGARPDAPDDFGWTPLHEACGNGNEEVVALFLQLPFNLEGASKKSETALHLATRHGHIKILARLLKAGANHNYRNPAGNTPLHVAAAAGRLDLMKLLHDHGADVTAKNLMGETPLHAAAKEGWTEAAEWCLANGCSPDDLNKEDRNFIDLAVREGRNAFIQHFANLEQPIPTDDNPDPLTATGIRRLVAKDAMTLAVDAMSPGSRLVSFYFFGKSRVGEGKGLLAALELFAWFFVFPFSLGLFMAAFSEKIIPQFAIFNQAGGSTFIGPVTPLANTFLVFLVSHLLVTTDEKETGFGRLVWAIRYSAHIRIIHFALVAVFFVRELRFDRAFWVIFSKFWLGFLFLYTIAFIFWWVFIKQEMGRKTS